MEKCLAKGFPKSVSTWISEKKYQELREILSRDPSLTISELVRRILQHQPVRLQVRSGDLSEVMEALSGIQSSLERIGVHLNQGVIDFHGNTSSLGSFFWGKKLFAQQQELSREYDKIQEVLAQLQLKWLSE